MLNLSPTPDLICLNEDIRNVVCSRRNGRPLVMQQADKKILAGAADMLVRDAALIHRDRRARGGPIFLQQDRIRAVIGANCRLQSFARDCA